MLHKRRKKGRCSHLRSQLADILTCRAQGLLTRSEYEEKLEEVELSLPEAGRLVERELPGGEIQFVLRETYSGRTLGAFKFRGGHEI